MTVSDPAHGSPEFPIEWVRPSDPEMTWDWDDMHMPFALSPLASDYAVMLEHGFRYRYERLGVPFEILARVWNGYAYYAFRTNVPEAEEDAVMSRYREARRAQIPTVAAYWRDEALPELREAYDWIASRAVDELSAAELVEAWEGAWARATQAWRIHFYVIAGPYQVLEDLADLYDSVAPDPAPGEAMRLIQGSIDELQQVERDLEALALRAAAVPDVASRLVAAPVPSLEELAALPGAEGFAAGVRDFLTAHGHLGQGFDDLGLASWGEEPERLLEDLGKRLRQPATPAEERRDRLAAEADDLADAVRGRLADRPDDLERFESLLAHAREIGRLTETHNYWIDRMVQARLRAFAMRVGRRLVADGVLADPSDILYLRRAEVPDVVISRRDMRQVTAERRAEHERQRGLKPPRHVGRTREAPHGDRFDGARFDPDPDGTLRGTGASAGVVRGTARVVLGPADFGRVQAGDIIVAPSSNPSWVPLFAIAGGLLTNTGGVLSHAAVVAREFALPAVVGLSDVTTRVADGRTVELDGTTGVVRLL